MTCEWAGRKRKGEGQELHNVQRERRRGIGGRKEDEARHRMCACVKREEDEGEIGM
jgi:hypothetical protein